MNTERLLDQLRALGLRIKFGREAMGLSQQELTAQMGIADRQTLSAIENAERQIQPEELVKISELLGRSVEWFLDPFVVAGEGEFSWRVSRDMNETDLRDFEERSGRLVGLLRFLRISNSHRFDPLASSLRLGVGSSYEQATAVGEAVAAKLELGRVPAATLVEKIEEALEIPVLFVESNGHGDRVSGAMCRLPDLGVILINRRESAPRRSFDAAHELFHALTWDAMKPEHIESSEPSHSERGGKSTHARIERLADSFAAGLLMPKPAIDRVFDPNRAADINHLVEVATVLQVSPTSLGYRLLNAGLISKEACSALKTRITDDSSPTPKLFSRKFAEQLHDGIAAGHVSSLKAAKALEMTLDEMADLLREHGLEAPFRH